MKILINIFLIPFIDITFSSPVRFRNPSKALRNHDLFDGDIVLKSADDVGNTFFNTIPNDNQLWPHAIIPYEIDIELRGIKNLIESAFKHIQEKTCVRFKPRRDERDYIYIHLGDGDSCQSMVGLAGGRQEVALGYGCQCIGTILHELMHVIGFYHEHSRSDRDTYLEIHLENVIEGKEKNFQILEPNQNRIFQPFDYQSIMIYGETSFSKNSFPTMLAKNREKLTDPHFKHTLTHYDIRSIKDLYHCH